MIVFDKILKKIYKYPLYSIGVEDETTFWAAEIVTSSSFK